MAGTYTEFHEAKKKKGYTKNALVILKSATDHTKVGWFVCYLPKAPAKIDPERWCEVKWAEFNPGGSSEKNAAGEVISKVLLKSIQHFEDWAAEHQAQADIKNYWGNVEAQKGVEHVVSKRAS